MDPDPVIIPPELEIEGCVQTPLGNSCNSAYHWEPSLEDFTVPDVWGTAPLKVCNADHYAIRQYVYLVGGGWFKVISRSGSDTIIVENFGHYGNAVAATVVPEGAAIIPSGVMLDTGFLSFAPALAGQGLLFQFGEATPTFNAGATDELLAAVTFPQPFVALSGGAAWYPPTCPQIHLTPRPLVGPGGLFSIYVMDVQMTGFKIYGSNAFAVNQTIPIRWIALG